MMKKAIVLPLVLFFTLILPLALGRGEPDQWQNVGPGIDYQEFKVGTSDEPVRAFVARMDRAVQEDIIDTSLGQGRLLWGRESVSGMSERYDQAINFWGSWGVRNRVVVAINGSFYGGAFPDSGMIQSGWYIKRFNDFNGGGGGSGFAWKMNRTPFIGECVIHPPDKQVITDTVTKQSIEFDGINMPRDPNKLIIYTSQYDSDTGTDDTGVEVMVEMTRTMTIIPKPRAAYGYVREIYTNTGSSPIPFDYVVLSATEGKQRELLSKIHVGDRIGISQEIVSKDLATCNTPIPLLDWTKTFASLTFGNYILLKDGEIQPSETPRDPRTAIAYNDQFIYFIVVDGRQPGYSVGMTVNELSIFARDTLSATWGVNEDGGGSSTMVINGNVVNHPSDPCHGVYLPLIGKTGTGQPLPSPTPSTSALNPSRVNFTCQRRVANGVMMITVEPMVSSSTFETGDTVMTLSPMGLRLGPGTNYARLATIPASSQGKVIAHFNHLDGVEAKGDFWWKVDINGVVGWAPESSLTKVISKVGGIFDLH